MNYPSPQASYDLHIYTIPQPKCFSWSEFRVFYLSLIRLKKMSNQWENMNGVDISLGKLY